jgi:hypothetical protein
MDQMQMFLNEPIEEVLREKTNYYYENKKEIDFWILVNPKFLDPELLRKRMIQYLMTEDPSFAVLISQDKKFIDWMKLRMGHFVDLYEEDETKIDHAREIHGFYGVFDWDENKNKESVLSFDKNFLSIPWYTKFFEENIHYYFQNKREKNN